MSLRRVLVANRGEIALRIVRACRDAGVQSVAVHGSGDRGAPYTRLADEAVDLGGTSAADTYLDIAKLLGAAARTGADAVHPGYGFLAENADFAQAVIDAGLTWIGPPPDVIRALGDKVRARAIAEAADAPLTPGSDAAIGGPEDVEAFVREHGLPVAIKAAHGGGGRGMRIARRMDEIPELVAAASREASAAFGRSECFVESYVERGRHLEAQMLADRHGGIVVLGTRDCTLQRRYQKLVEEAPAPFLTDVVRKELERCATDICRAAGYVNAGTVEFLLSPDGALFFLEVNARLQVEHSVTEESLGVDVVRAQLAVADGESVASALARGDDDPSEPTIRTLRRHAIEFRINAEDPARGFAPSTGTITGLRVPAGPGIRLDSGVEVGSVVDGAFDSMLAKLIVSGRNRGQALERARRALDEFVIEGIDTTLPFVRDILRVEAFVAGDAAGFAVHTRWIDEDYVPSASPGVDGTAAVRIGTRWLPVELPGIEGATSERLIAVRAQAHERGQRADAAAGDVLTSPMQGTVIRLAVAEGDAVEAGQLVAVVEAMKMENQLTAPHDGTITGLRVDIGDTVAQGDVLCHVEAT